MKTIDVTTTALIRPRLLEKTYRSFRENMFGDQKCRLFLNVDPFGDTDEYNQEDVVKVARKYFETVVTRTPAEANMTKALKWLWGQVQTEFFFNLEDDWELKVKLNFPHMLRAMQRHPELGSLRLARCDSDETTAQLFRYYLRRNGTFKQLKRAVWNGDYYEHPKLQFTGMPALIRKEFILLYVKELRDNEAQEETYHNLIITNSPIAKNWKHGGYTEKNVKSTTVVDIGKKWKRKRRIVFAKRKGKHIFPWYNNEN